jgi:MerR family transcriptional regulator, light-induced transcriptional regulator
MLRNGSSDEASHAESCVRQGAEACPGNGGAATNPNYEGFGSDAKMASLIEDEIIPKLIAAHCARGVSGFPESEQREESFVSRMAPDVVADTALDREPDALMDMVEKALAGGLTPESLLVDVLAPAARHLGSRWDNDTADFIDVTMGLWRMQEIVHELAARRPDHFVGPGMLAPLPGPKGISCSLLRPEIATVSDL